MKRIFPLLILCASLLLLSACGKADTIVLMPDADGKVGKVTVTAKEGSQTLSQAGQATQVTPGEKPSKPEVMPASEVQNIFGRALAAQPQPPLAFNLYFVSGSTQLTTASREMLPQIVAAIKGQEGRDISVIGHADTAGDETYNVIISRRRAQAVRKMLVKLGVDEADIEATSHGEKYPLVPTADGVHEPKNRRVEVIVR